MVHRFLLAFGIVAAAPTVQAGDLSRAASGPAPLAVSSATGTPDLVFTLGGGVAVSPEYFGSGDYRVGPSLGFRLNYLDLGPLQFGSLDPAFQPEGIGIRGSFRFIGARETEDYPELSGLEDVDTTLEAGLGIGYRSYSFDAFADIRYGFFGHESFVGELGADYKVHPSERLTVTMGPRILIGSDDYASAYFDVPPGTGNFASSYDADGGVVSAGVELGARYAISNVWDLEGAVTYDRFVGDAADSPIVEQGERDQYGVRIGLTRQITLDF